MDKISKTNDSKNNKSNPSSDNKSRSRHRRPRPRRRRSNRCDNRSEEPVSTSKAPDPDSDDGEEIDGYPQVAAIKQIYEHHNGDRMFLCETCGAAMIMTPELLKNTKSTQYLWTLHFKTPEHRRKFHLGLRCGAFWTGYRLWIDDKNSSGAKFGSKTPEVAQLNRVHEQWPVLEQIQSDIMDSLCLPWSRCTSGFFYNAHEVGLEHMALDLDSKALVCTLCVEQMEFKQLNQHIRSYDHVFNVVRHEHGRLAYVVEKLTNDRDRRAAIAKHFGEIGDGGVLDKTGRQIAVRSAVIDRLMKQQQKLNPLPDDEQIKRATLFYMVLKMSVQSQKASVPTAVLDSKLPVLGLNSICEIGLKLPDGSQSRCYLCQSCGVVVTSELLIHHLRELRHQAIFLMSKVSPQRSKELAELLQSEKLDNKADLIYKLSKRMRDPPEKYIEKLNFDLFMSDVTKALVPTLSLSVPSKPPPEPPKTSPPKRSSTKPVSKDAGKQKPSSKPSQKSQSSSATSSRKRALKCLRSTSSKEVAFPKAKIARIELDERHPANLVANLVYQQQQLFKADIETQKLRAMLLSNVITSPVQATDTDIPELSECGAALVGTEFICEVQHNERGVNLVSCFLCKLCGWLRPSSKLIEHLLSARHRLNSLKSTNEALSSEIHSKVIAGEYNDADQLLVRSCQTLEQSEGHAPLNRRVSFTLLSDKRTRELVPSLWTEIDESTSCKTLPKETPVILKQLQQLVPHWMPVLIGEKSSHGREIPSRLRKRAESAVADMLDPKPLPTYGSAPAPTTSFRRVSGLLDEDVAPWAPMSLSELQPLRPCKMVKARLDIGESNAGIPLPVTAEVFHSIFKLFGEVLRILTYGCSNTEAMIEFADVFGAHNAIRDMNGKVYKGCRVNVQPSNENVAIDIKNNNRYAVDYTIYTNPVGGEGGKDCPDVESSFVVHLSNLPVHTSNAQIMDLCASFGKVLDFVFCKKDPSRQNRLSALVEFEESQAVVSMLKHCGPLVLEGRTIVCKHSNRVHLNSSTHNRPWVRKWYESPHAANDHQKDSNEVRMYKESELIFAMLAVENCNLNSPDFQQATLESEKKVVLISDLPQDISKSELQELCALHGKVVASIFIKNNQALVEFEDKEAAQALVSRSMPMVIRNHTILCRYSRKQKLFFADDEDRKRTNLVLQNPPSSALIAIPLEQPDLDKSSEIETQSTKSKTICNSTATAQPVISRLKSRVVHLDVVPVETTNTELLDACVPFGKVFDFVISRSKSLALVEFEERESAVRMVTYAECEPIVVHGKPISCTYSKHAHIEFAANREWVIQWNESHSQSIQSNTTKHAGLQSHGMVAQANALRNRRMKRHVAVPHAQPHLEKHAHSEPPEIICEVPPKTPKTVVQETATPQPSEAGPQALHSLPPFVPLSGSRRTIPVQQQTAAEAPSQLTSDRSPVSKAVESSDQSVKATIENQMSNLLKLAMQKERQLDQMPSTSSQMLKSKEQSSVETLLLHKLLADQPAIDRSVKAPVQNQMSNLLNLAMQNELGAVRAVTKPKETSSVETYLLQKLLAEESERRRKEQEKQRQLLTLLTKTLTNAKDDESSSDSSESESEEEQEQQQELIQLAQRNLNAIRKTRETQPETEGTPHPRLPRAFPQLWQPKPPGID